MRLPKLLIFYVSVLLLTLMAQTSFGASLQKARDFELKGVDGRTYTISDQSGKVVLLNFWATWCPECIEENPLIDKLYKRFRDAGLVVFGISIDRSLDTLREYLSKEPLSYTILHDPKGDVFVKRYAVLGLPTTFLINKDGFIVEKMIGKQDFTSEGFIQKIEALLKDGR